MPAQSNIVIDDGQTTPVSHTFKVNGTMMGQDKKSASRWVDVSPATRLAYHTLTEVQAPPNGVGVEKVKWVLAVPVLKQASGETSGGFVPSPTLDYTNYLSIEVAIDQRTSDAVRKDIAAYLKNFAALDYVKNKVETLEWTY